MRELRGSGGPLRGFRKGTASVVLEGPGPGQEMGGGQRATGPAWPGVCFGRSALAAAWRVGDGGRLGRKPRREALQTPGDMSSRLEEQRQAGRSDASEAESRVPVAGGGVRVSPAAPGLDSEEDQGAAAEVRNRMAECAGPGGGPLSEHAPGAAGHCGAQQWASLEGRESPRGLGQRWRAACPAPRASVYTRYAGS